MSQEKSDSIALLGGSFNPVHFGHLRLAVEVYEAVRPDRLDFIPTANPPHKPGLGLLPFAMRVAALREVCAAYPAFRVSTLEAERDGPSFTCDTLAEYRRRYPQSRLFFVLGSEDFVLLDTWKDWQRLPELATLLVVPRQGVEEDEFIEHALRLWPQARPEQGLHPGVRVGFKVQGAGEILYMPLPRLDINASLVRRRWLAGRSIDFWVPREVVATLSAQAETVINHWKQRV